MKQQNAEQERKLKWSCQGCGKEVFETVIGDAAAAKRSSELYIKEYSRTLSCGCNKPIYKCERCGACCAFSWTIFVTTNERIKKGHIRCEGESCFTENEWEGDLKQMRKPWLNGARACILLSKHGCPLHGTDDQPAACADFNCRNPRDQKKDAANPHLAEDFVAFRKQWLSDGLDKLFRGAK